MPATETYDPGLVAMNFGGVPIAGYADGTFISVERNAKTFSYTPGSGGEGTRVRNRDRSGKVMLTLLASDPTNDKLMAVQALDELTGQGVGPLLVKDNGGTTLVSAANAWITGIPPVKMSKGAETREWEIECKTLNVFVGGNAVL